MDNRKKPWSDDELKQLLLIMKKGYFSKLSNESTEPNLEVYESISKEMVQHKMNRTARQIRDKFNWLWLDYVKLEKTKDYSKAGRQTLEQLDLLKEIFSHNKGSKATTELQDPLSEDRAIEVDDDDNDDDEYNDNDEEITDYITSESEDSENETNNDLPEEEQKNENDTASANNSVLKDKKCQLFTKVIANFTKDWKSSQRSLLENLKRQDAKDLRTITKQYKNQEALLRKNREELKKILEQDRQEMKNFLENALRAIPSISTPNGVTNDLQVKEENDENEDFKINLA